MLARRSWSIGPVAGTEYRGKRGEAVVKSDLAAGSASAKDFDALVIPGGHAPDKMRMRHAMVDSRARCVDVRQARRRHLPRAAGADLGQRAPRPYAHVLAVDCDRRQERRRPVRRQARRRRRQPDHVAKTRRCAGVQRSDRPSVDASYVRVSGRSFLFLCGMRSPMSAA